MHCVFVLDQSNVAYVLRLTLETRPSSFWGFCLHTFQGRHQSNEAFSPNPCVCVCVCVCVCLSVCLCVCACMCVYTALRVMVTRDLNTYPTRTEWPTDRHGWKHYLLATLLVGGPNYIPRRVASGPLWNFKRRFVTHIFRSIKNITQDINSTRPGICLPVL